MLKNTLIRQKDLDITTRAQAVLKIETPVAIKYNNSRRSIVISRGKEIEINEYDSIACSGYDELRKGSAQLIPITDFISELEAIIAEVKKAHGLDAKVLEWDLTPEFERVSKVAQL